MMSQTISLNADWQFRQVDTKSWLSAQVPGCVHTDLLRHALIEDPFVGQNEWAVQWIEEKEWDYRLEFTLGDAELDCEHVDLAADGLDTFATVVLNGEEVGRAQNMFVGYRWQVKELLRTGKNVLEIRFASPMNAIRQRQPILEPMQCDSVGGRHQIRKQQCSFGWDWGPRLTTSGIWRPIRLEAWSSNRLKDVVITQQHARKRCTLKLAAETASKRKGFSLRARASLDEQLVGESEGSLGASLELVIAKPELWWPNGMGAQPIYLVEVELLNGSEVIDTWQQRIGLCETQLDCHPDKWGTSFQFLVNGKPVFAKGANWIPAHSFINEGEALMLDLLDSAADAHMNMVRVWGGGIYETDTFYDACLERGLLIWQDFMFACCVYPSDREFTSWVKQEAEYQVRRLRNHSHIALWCGNNEIEQLTNHLSKDDPKAVRAYDRMFRKLLPDTLKKLAPGADYISSSEHNPDDPWGDTNNQESGDAHYWGVWFMREPVNAYEKQYHRFFSEFGMQAYPHVETARTFTQSRNLFGADMNSHQKNGGGNEIIFHYISQLFRFPKNYEATVYQSQIMQAFCIRTGIEHMRRSAPRTMGALYWQLNDCWPVASWSSIDFGGRWRALQYSAKRFFAPALVSVKVLGDEWTHPTSNTLMSEVHGVELHTVCDLPMACTAELSWDLWSIRDSKPVETGSTAVKLSYGKSVRRKVLNFKSAITAHGCSDLVLRTRLVSSEGEALSCNTTFLTAPRHIEFPQAKIASKVSVGAVSGTYQVELSCDALAYQVYINLDDAIAHRVSDNFFDLLPGEVKIVTLRPSEAFKISEIRKALQVYSYRDSYED